MCLDNICDLAINVSIAKFLNCKIIPFYSILGKYFPTILEYEKLCPALFDMKFSFSAILGSFYSPIGVRAGMRRYAQVCAGVMPQLLLLFYAGFSPVSVFAAIKPALVHGALSPLIQIGE